MFGRGRSDEREEQRMRALRHILVAWGTILLGASAQAQTNVPADVQAYPSKPITIVVPFGPGSATDTIARIIGQQLSTALNQTVLIEDKPGANGAIAAAYVARAAPDGYTLFLSTNSPHSAAPTLNKTIAYDPVKDFAPISRAGSYTLMLVLNPDVPAKSIPELIAYAKANPGKLSFASGNSSGVVAGETLKSWAGINIVHVPYRSVPPALNDVLGGRVSMMFADLTTGMPHVKANALRALAVTRMQRSKLIPELPTLNEAGVANFDMDSWAAIFAPANTPPEIVTRLNGELRKIIDNPEIKAKMAAMGFEAFSSSPEELGDFVKAQLVKWTKMIKDAGIEPE
jgi:putative tricarboxylic transport membrane protein